MIPVTLRGVTGDASFDHYFVDVKMKVSCKWKVRECGWKVKVLKVSEVERGKQQKEHEVKLKNRSILELEVVEGMEEELKKFVSGEYWILQRCVEL